MPISIIQKLEKDFTILKAQLGRLAKDLQEARRAASKEAAKKVNKKLLPLKPASKKLKKSL